MRAVFLIPVLLTGLGLADVSSADQLSPLSCSMLLPALRDGYSVYLRREYPKLYKKRAAATEVFKQNFDHLIDDVEDFTTDYMNTYKGMNERKEPTIRTAKLMKPEEVTQFAHGILRKNPGLRDCVKPPGPKFGKNTRYAEVAKNIPGIPGKPDTNMGWICSVKGAGTPKDMLMQKHIQVTMNPSPALAVYASITCQKDRNEKPAPDCIQDAEYSAEIDLVSCMSDWMTCKIKQSPGQTSRAERVGYFKGMFEKALNPWKMTMIEYWEYIYKPQSGGAISAENQAALKCLREAEAAQTSSEVQAAAITGRAGAPERAQPAEGGLTIPSAGQDGAGAAP